MTLASFPSTEKLYLTLCSGLNAFHRLLYYIWVRYKVYLYKIIHIYIRMYVTKPSVFGNALLLAALDAKLVYIFGPQWQKLLYFSLLKFVC